MHQVNIEKASTIPLPQLIDSVVQGDGIIFTQDDKPVAKLTAIRQDKPVPKFGSAKGKIIFNEGWDDPIEDFEEYM